MSVETDAISLSCRYFSTQGYQVEDVSRNREHRGYDLVISKGNERATIEVKGCTREWQIPDLYVTEFDKEKRLVADFLCVVYLLRKQKPFVCLVPRDAISPDLVSKKQGYRISSRFKKRAVLEQYVKPLKFDC